MVVGESTENLEQNSHATKRDGRILNSLQVPCRFIWGIFKNLTVEGKISNA